MLIPIRFSRLWPFLTHICICSLRSEKDMEELTSCCLFCFFFFRRLSRRTIRKLPVRCWWRATTAWRPCPVRKSWWTAHGSRRTRSTKPCRLRRRARQQVASYLSPRCKISRWRSTLPRRRRRPSRGGSSTSSSRPGRASSSDPTRLWTDCSTLLTRPRPPRWRTWPLARLRPPPSARGRPVGNNTTSWGACTRTRWWWTRRTTRTLRRTRRTCTTIPGRKTTRTRRLSRPGGGFSTGTAVNLTVCSIWGKNWTFSLILGLWTR